MFGGTTSVGFLVHASRATAPSGKEEHVSFGLATELTIVRPRHHNIVLYSLNSMLRDVSRGTLKRPQYFNKILASQY